MTAIIPACADGWVSIKRACRSDAAARYASTPKASFWDLLRLAKTAIISFSSLPLTMFYALAAVSLAVMAALSAFTLYHKLITGLAVPGWTSHIITASFFGALNALGIAILGEYVLKIYNQVRCVGRFIWSSGSFPRRLLEFPREIPVSQELQCSPRWARRQYRRDAWGCW